jgi:hypothetical protein
MKADWLTIILVGCLGLLLAACGQVIAPTLPDETPSALAATLPEVDSQMDPTTALPSEEPEDNETRMTQPTEPFLHSGMKLLVEKAKQDLSQRLGISVESVTVSAVIGQEFSTNAFYCRATKGRISKDESPTVISGLSILLRASGRRYEYHASDQMIIFCRALP